MGRTRPLSVTALAVALLLAAGCSTGGRATTAAAGTPATGSPATSFQTPTAPLTQTPSAPAPPPALPSPPSKADLQGALLSLADVPTGYSLHVSATDGRLVASSPVPACAPLVALFNAPATTGAVGSADVSLDGGNDNASIDETLNSLPTPAAAVAAVESETAAVAACSKVTVTVPQLGRVPFSVAQISFPTVGDRRTAARLTATGTGLEGVELLEVAVATGDVVVHVSLYDPTPTEAEDVTTAAVDKVQQVLGAGDGGSA